MHYHTYVNSVQLITDYPISFDLLKDYFVLRPVVKFVYLIFFYFHVLGKSERP